MNNLEYDLRFRFSHYTDFSPTDVNEIIRQCRAVGLDFHTIPEDEAQEQSDKSYREGYVKALEDATDAIATIQQEM